MTTVKTPPTVQELEKITREQFPVLNTVIQCKACGYAVTDDNVRMKYHTHCRTPIWTNNKQYSVWVRSVIERICNRCEYTWYERSLEKI